MPSLSGMKGSGYYNRHSSLQRATFEAVHDWVDEACAEARLPDEPAPITLADFGCSEGLNSILDLGDLVERLRSRRPTQPICVVHSDLPTNDFNQLFANLHDPGADNYLQSRGVRRDNVFAFVAGDSFYGPLLPPRSTHLAISMLAVEWMDRLPDIAVPEFVGYMRARDEVRAAFAQQAERDWTAFLKLRAAELAPGGMLMVVIPGSDGVRRCSDGIYDVLNDAFLDLVEAGRVDRTHYDRLVFPVYFRTIEEMRAPIERADSPPSDLFTIRRTVTLEVPTPFVEQFQRTGDREAYASQYTAMLRAFTDPVVLATLADRDDAEAISDALFDRVRERFLAEPDRYAFHNIEVGVLLERN